MNLEPIIQSKMGQKEKDKYCILTHINEFKKMIPMIPHAGQQRRHSYNEQIFGLNWRRQGWNDLRE